MTDTSRGPSRKGKGPHYLNVREAIISHPACGGYFPVPASVAEETVFELRPLDCQKCGAKAVPAENFDYLIEPRMEPHQWLAKSRAELAEIKRKQAEAFQEQIAFWANRRKAEAAEEERIAGARSREKVNHHTDERAPKVICLPAPESSAPEIPRALASGNVRYKIFGQKRLRDIRERQSAVK